MESHAVTRIPLQLARNCIVASIQVDLNEAVLAQFREDLLGLLQRSGAGGVILDVSGVEILDLDEFNALRHTMGMVQLMGAQMIFSGFQPGVISALVELDANTAGITAALNLDAAFALLESEDASPTENEPGEAAGDELLEAFCQGPAHRRDRSDRHDRRGPGKAGGAGVRKDG